MKQIQVRLKDRSYPILVRDGLLREVARRMEELGLKDRHWVVVSQEPVWSLHGPALTSALQSEKISFLSFITPRSKTSEASKTQAVWLKLVSYIAAQDGANRGLGVLALGGGVIGDLAGFASSVYRRGLPLIQLPTTLTAQVDSAIGGKNGIDLPTGKNLMGTIYQPRAVLCDPSVLKTLPQRHWSDGCAEVIKYGVIRDAQLFGWLEKSGLKGLISDRALLERVILRCAAIKADVVSADEFDRTGVRMALNFGHTCGHAIEAASAYSRAYTHGEAVGIGMLIACDIANELGILKESSLTERLERVLVKFDLPLFHKGLSTADLLKAIGYDKKSQGRQNRFILPVRVGKVVVVPGVAQDCIVRAIDRRRG